MRRREIHEVEAESDYIDTLLTFYEAIMASIDRWISVSWTFASIFIPASMVLAGILVSTRLAAPAGALLAFICLLTTICWGLLWYRTYMFNEAHLEQLARIERHLNEQLGIPLDLCPQLTIKRHLRMRFGLRTRYLKIKYIVAVICIAFSALWALLLACTLLGLL